MVLLWLLLCIIYALFTGGVFFSTRIRDRILDRSVRESGTRFSSDT